MHAYDKGYWDANWLCKAETVSDEMKTALRDLAAKEFSRWDDENLCREGFDDRLMERE